jgi:peroxiredoxin
MHFRLLAPLVLVALAAWQSAASAAPTIGTKIDDFTLPNHLGKDQSLAELSGENLTVVAFLGTECPLAKLYAGRLQAIADEYADRGVAVVAVMSNVQDSLEEIAAYVRRHELSYSVLKDQRNAAANQFAAERTPTVFVLDSDRVVRYSGRVDDQYVVGIVRDKPTREDLKAALDELLAGKEVATPTTDALGCIIGRVREATGDDAVTYARDIAPILQERCVECHRPGEIGPFELTSYEEAAGWGEMMVEVVRDQRMPPWHASPEHGVFANDRSMPEAEKELLYQWVANGCPEGDPNDAPAPRQYTSGWQMPREPDVVLSMEKPFDVPADAGKGGVPYQYFVVPTGFTEDTWIEAAEVLPGNRAVLHHVIAYLAPKGERDRDDWIFLSAYVPGLRFDGLPAKSAKLVPKDYVLVLENHYTPNGSPQQDTTKVGILLADKSQIENEVVTTELVNPKFAIPPGDDNYQVTATSQPLKQEATVLSLSPHMHLRGKAFKYELVLADGTRTTLLDVPAYDFNWQTRYVLAEPLKVPAGAVIHARAWFDNSASNLANPDPTATVHWGDQSWDEMMLGYFDVLTPRDDSRQAGTKIVHTGLDLVGIFDGADADGDLGLSAEEAKPYDRLVDNFALIDGDGDKLLQLREIIAAVAAMGRVRGSAAQSGGQ